MNLTKALALLALTIVFWFGQSHAHEVVGESPHLSGFFANQRECRDARKDATLKAEALCKKMRHRGVDPRSLRFGGCWGQLSSKRTMSVHFSCE